MNSPIYRKVALDQVASPDQLDQLIVVTNSRHWITLLAAGLLIVVATGWGLFGRIATKAEGRGVMLRSGNLVSVSTLAQGQIDKVLVKPGDIVAPGQMVATIRQPEIEEKLRATQNQLARMGLEATRKVDLRASASRLEISTIRQQREALNQREIALRRQISDVSDQIPVHEELLAKGLITRQQVSTLSEKKAELENALATVRAQIGQLSADEFKVETSVRQTQLESERETGDLRTNLQLLEGQFAQNTEVRSPFPGQITDVHVQIGSLIAPSSPILTLQPTRDVLEVVAFFPAQKSKQMRPGMQAQIVPSTVKAEEHGYMLGTVVSVSEYPSTDANIMRVFQNNALASAVSGGAVHEVRVALTRDNTTFSGFKWSSKGGAPIKVTPATLCSVRVVTQEQAPIALVIPGIKTVLGVE